MRRRLQVGLGFTILVLSAMAVARQAVAQSAPAPNPWTAATSTATPTDTTGKSKQYIEVNSFSNGASNPSSVTSGKGAQQGKSSVSEINVSGPKTVTPVYKGPGIVVPPSGGKPNDSAQHHPKH